MAELPTLPIYRWNILRDNNMYISVISYISLNFAFNDNLFTRLLNLPKSTDFSTSFTAFFKVKVKVGNTEV